MLPTKIENVLSLAYFVGFHYSHFSFSDVKVLLEKRKFQKYLVTPVGVVYLMCFNCKFKFNNRNSESITFTCLALDVFWSCSLTERKHSLLMQSVLSN